jgi:transcription elongation factor Elf1
MEYVGNCPKCDHHVLVETTKQLNHEKRKPQRVEKCSNCGKKARITIIGEVERVPNYALSSTPEYATHNRLLFHFWA